MRQAQRHTLDGISFRLFSDPDLSWLQRYGKAFVIIDQTGSGCVCFGMDDGITKRFVKVAGLDTIHAEIDPERSIETLKKAVDVYKSLEHPHLITLLDDFSIDHGYVAVFEWACGSCLFEHWNFDQYRNGKPDPRKRFRMLPAEKKLCAAEVLFSFLEHVAQRGYVAVDFYDGSLIYDFEKDTLKICDIDLFEKEPLINTIGKDFWGTKRLKAPEEYEKGAVIDERTNEFTLGALLFDFFGQYTTEQIRARYQNARFVPCALKNWSLGPHSYKVVCRAVDPDPDRRYKTIALFHEAFKNAVEKER
ncbi:hypothetical protein [uncultured Dubosiella sp.]|jgi:serine/threonine-protein kinase|uniref:hypothetical protein n=1 Tax=uncultured Dubosiella sp. TaxID=1937011 RepID=UPI00208AD251|nr:hypothetical protein [uncultured Dubosiella sp.]GJM56507.1 serine/threonine protein kinase [Erysipelotrichaceae bacterium OPF54]